MREYKLYQPSKGDLLSISSDAISNPKEIAVGKFLNTNIENYKFEVSDKSSFKHSTGLIHEIIITKYTIKDIISILKSLVKHIFGFIFRTNKLVMVKFSWIK